MSFIPLNYYEALALVESAGNPNARAKTSSASGLYQFTKGTWEDLGYDWKDVFNVNYQQEAIREFTNRNVISLSRAGIDITGGSLYAAHFLGPKGAVDVYGASRDAPLSSVVSGNVIKANPFLKGMSVGDFINWSEGKISKASSGVDKFVSTIKTAAGGGQKSDGSSSSSKVATAATVFAQTGNPIAAVVAGFGEDLAGGPKKDGLLDWLKNLFSAETFGRVIAVIIGILLIAIAIFYLSGTDKVIVETGKTLAKTAI